MKEPLTCLLLGVGIGIAIGYMKEDEITDLSYRRPSFKETDEEKAPHHAGLFRLTPFLGFLYEREME